MSFVFSPFSEKQLDFICNSDAFINIASGAVRAGKTIGATIRWINFVYESPHTRFLMTGKSADTLYRNVIEDIEKICGDDVRYVKSSSGGAKLIFKIPNDDGGVIEKVCYCVGAYDEGSESRIRGMTVGGWVADEVTLYPESFITQAINRMSLAGAKAFWTTNPDSPYHYIKTEYIDKVGEKNIKCWYFDMDDNLSLTEEYKDNLKGMYSGIWEKRMIRGLWVLAEGVIYDNFNNDIHVIGDDDLPERFDKMLVGIDYGTSNATGFTLVGVKDGVYYFIKEYYYSGRDTQRSKSDLTYSKDLQAFIEGYDVWRIFIDPSAASFITQLKDDGVQGIYPADHDVLNGIRTMQGLIDKKRLFIHRRCVNLLKEIATYTWCPKAQKRGEDKPIKENDHMLDSARYVCFTDAGMSFTLY